MVVRDAMWKGVRRSSEIRYDHSSPLIKRIAKAKQRTQMKQARSLKKVHHTYTGILIWALLQTSTQFKQSTVTTDIAEPLFALNELDQLADLTGTEFGLSESHVDDSCWQYHWQR